MASVKRGVRFGKWTVIGEERHKRANGHRYWTCRCDCGTVKEVVQSGLLGGCSQQCEKCARVKHGLRKTKEYGVWKTMKYRCNNPSNQAYSRYGGRGIKVCDRWNDSFAAFYEDMGPKPSPDYTLERVDNNGPYEPGNCIWADLVHQANNRRSNRFISAQGRTMTMAEWSRHLGIGLGTIWSRLNRGWTDEDAVTVPVRKQKRRS